LEAAAADAAAFLEWSVGTNKDDFAHAHLTVGQQAFRTGDLAGAEQHYLAAQHGGNELQSQALAALGSCRSAQGDYRSAVDYFLQAAEAAAAATEPAAQQQAPLQLYRAARAAQEGRLTSLANQLAGRMVQEYPGSYLTTRLVGYEVLPVPEI
jgi:hypothetical protein